MTMQRKKKKRGHQDSETDEDEDYRIYYTPTDVGLRRWLDCRRHVGLRGT